jgi:signal transduction histidine kinase
MKAAALAQTQKLFLEGYHIKQLNNSGLGLFISKGIVDAHNGRIWAENNSDGKVATFAFTPPVFAATLPGL